MKKTLMIVGGGINEIPAVIIAKEKGITTIVIDQNPKALGLQDADVAILADIKDCHKILKIAEKHQIDGIITVSIDVALKTVSYVAQMLSLPKLSSKAVEIATDKIKMRKCLTENRVSQPNYQVMFNRVNLQRALTDIGYPAIVKPPDRSASRGIFRIDNPSQLDEAYSVVSANTNKDKYLLEEFVFGTEHSIEAFTINGQTTILGICDRILTDPPYRTNRWFSYPSQISDEDQKLCKDFTEKAHKCLNIDQGPSHTEIILTEDGPKLMEIHPRCGGARIGSHVIPSICGVNMIEQLINFALRTPVDLNSTQKNASVVRFLLPKPGRIIEIEGINTVRNLKGVIDVCLFYQVGDVLPQLKDGTHRAGYIITAAPTLSLATEIAQYAESLIRFYIR